MKRVFDANNITYAMYDNSFSFISDIDKAQELADKFDSKKLFSHLDLFSERVNSFLPTVKDNFGKGYYWCASQIEYATDIIFKSHEALKDLYPSMVGSARMCSVSLAENEPPTSMRKQSPIINNAR